MSQVGMKANCITIPSSVRGGQSINFFWPTRSLDSAQHEVFTRDLGMFNIEEGQLEAALN